MAATRAFYYLAPSSRHTVFVSPLLRLLHTSKEVERVILSYVEVIAQDEPVRDDFLITPMWQLSSSLQHLFASNYTHFIVKTSDFPVTKQLKLKILTSLLNAENWSTLLREFVVRMTMFDTFLVHHVLTLLQVYAEDSDTSLAGSAIRCIGAVARKVHVSEAGKQSLDALMDLVKRGSGKRI
jgi:AP-3 complex subunit beta